MDLERKIEGHEARVCVMGLGYVGLPLAMGFARLGYTVTGLDVDAARVASIMEGRSYIQDVSSSDLADVVGAGSLEATFDPEALREADIIFICVPTPFTKTKTPDLSYVVTAAEEIARRLKPGQLIVLQSTTYPGTTEEDVLPILETSGLVAGRDFHLAFSPERVNPGDRRYDVTNTPKVVGGVSARCAHLAQLVLQELMPEVYVVSSPRAAEMTKLLENIFRSVNIALINELAKLSERMNIDIWEVIEAASTKPFGFMPFYPGPGVGGHCVPVDPYYLFWKSREYDFYPRFIELAAELNQGMPYHVVSKISEALNSRGKTLQQARVLILGVSFKPDVDDARNAPAQRVIELLLSGGAEVSYNDPRIERFTVGKDVFYPEEQTLTSTPLTEQFVQNQDCVAIVAGHRSYDYQWIVDRAPVIVDTMNATRGVKADAGKIFRVGAPSPGR
ncbi:MAG TPA: nucleotide sugar dehydrogenase [Chloroflexi bacterium]|nr:nucleotide sugar dehydrogenase [Chloroflexota bacterium]